MLSLYFFRGGAKRDWPQVKQLGRFDKWLDLPQQYYEEPLDKVITYRVTRAAWGLLTIVGVGVISGFYGMGAGWALVPVTNLVMAAPLKVAAASSGILIGMGDCISVWPYILAGAVIPSFAALWLVGQVAGGIMGSRILITIKAGSVRVILIGVLLFSSFRLITKGLTTLGYISEVCGPVHIAVLLAIMVGVALSLTGKFPKLKSGRQDKWKNRRFLFHKLSTARLFIGFAS